eukprot:NODE_276_length_12087_cov_0.626376.p8 type:complete len:116 gc:universal NODE_276_length_12087_cov_0.626376:4662-5009(+)
MNSYHICVLKELNKSRIPYKSGLKCDAISTAKLRPFKLGRIDSGPLTTFFSALDLMYSSKMLSPTKKSLSYLESCLMYLVIDCRVLYSWLLRSPFQVMTGCSAIMSCGSASLPGK